MYVAELVTGAHNAEVARRYVDGHGEAMWCELYRSLERSDRDHWVDAETYGRPPGGFIGVFGYDIAKAYYESFDDADTGLAALLELPDSYDEIFVQSGFAERLARRCA